MKTYTIEEALQIGLYWVRQAADQSDLLAADARERGMHGSAANHEINAHGARQAFELMRATLKRDQA